ncbi:hypothetical protein HY404_04005 [Candidatus Microgenomates bacterium]|nr:hypothetical protein [Candidatus Microgenomates bacterium]
MQKRFNLAFLIGRGSRLPNILDKILTPDSPVAVTAVISHRKPAEGETDVIGITEAKRRDITAVYFNLVQMNLADKKAFLDHSDGQYRPNYMRNLAAFLSQSYYKPDLVFMTGWDLVVDDNFMSFFMKQNIPVLNVHPHPLPETPEETMVAPDGTSNKVLRGTEVWTQAVEEKLGWSGVTIHQVIPGIYDVGKVVALEWVKIDPADTSQTLRQKLNEVEDKLVPETILKIAHGEIKLAA